MYPKWKKTTMNRNEPICANMDQDEQMWNDEIEQTIGNEAERTETDRNDHKWNEAKWLEIMWNDA